MQDEKRDREIVVMYREDATVADICARFQICYWTLYAVIDGAGVPRRKAGTGRRPQATEEQIQRAVELYKEGELVGVITKSSGISFYTLKRALKRKGVPMRGRGGRVGSGKTCCGRKISQRGRRKQTTTNIAMLQQSYGADFVRLANGVLRGDLDFRI